MSTENPENQNLQITSVEQIKKHAQQVIVEGVPVMLPSGITVKLRRPSLQKMLQSGKIPSNLIGAAIKINEGKAPVDTKSADGFIEVVNLILSESFVEPKFSMNPGEEEVGPDDFTDDDKGFAFRYVYIGGKDLVPFRSK